jgi:hypothetical protein
MEPLRPELAYDSVEAAVHGLKAAVHLLAEVDKALVHGLEAAVYSLKAADDLLGEAVKVFAQSPQLGNFGPGRKDVLEGLLKFVAQGGILA